MQAAKLTEQQIITNIVKENLGRALFDAEHENELYIRYLAYYIKEIADEIWQNTDFALAMNGCIPIETIYAVSSDIEAGQLVVKGYEHLKTKEPNPNEKIRSKTYAELTESQRVVVDVLADFAKKKIPTDSDKDNTRITIRCWRRENKDLDELFDKYWLEPAAIALPAKAISTPRLRRFAKADIEKQINLA